MGQWYVLCDVLFNKLILIGEHHHFLNHKKNTMLHQYAQKNYEMEYIIIEYESL
jgi:hypothetical protein